MEKVTIVKTFSYCVICNHYLSNSSAHNSEYVIFELNILPYQSTLNYNYGYYSNMRNFNTNIGIAICVKHMPYKYRPFISYSNCNIFYYKEICYSLEEDIKRDFLLAITKKHIITI